MTDPILRLNAALSGRYEIEREVGQGGMATVYVARDLRHERKVALKVLKPELAAVVGAARFLAEIRTTANLQHPHILPLYDSGEADGLLFYVMPHVEGESLRKRLDREHQLPVDEAVRIARNVAEALDYAHRHGVIHRDIKPANILLQEGKPVVSDFGIALAVSAGGAGRLTETGLSLGTPHYMSPEQATGHLSVGPPTDVYALGCVLYEMLVGEPPYKGSTPQAVLAKIITTEPPSATEARKSVPPNVDAVIRKALDKVPADRFRSAAELARALVSGELGDGPIETATRAQANGAGRWAALTSTAVAAVAVTAAVWMAWGPRADSADVSVAHLNIVLPDSLPVMFVGEHWSGNGEPALALSPDGRWLAYVGPDRNTTKLFVRSLDGPGVRPLEGTAGAHSPAFSPDGSEIAFFAAGRLLRVSREGGAVQPIAVADLTHGPPTWADDGRLAMATNDGRNLRIIAADGGAAEIVLTSPPNISNPRWIPGTEWILFTCYDPRHVCATSSSGQRVRLTMDGGPVGDADSARLLYGSDARYVEPGYLVFSAPARNVLMGVRLNPETLEVQGRPEVLLEGIRREVYGAMQVSISKSGHLALARGSSAGLSRLAWAHGNGVIDTLPFPPRVYGAYSLSPDGRMLAIRIYPDVGSTELWFYDLENGPPGVQWDARDPGYAIWLPTSDGVVMLRGDEIVQIDSRSPRGWHVVGPALGFGTPLDASADGRLLFADSMRLAGARVRLVSPELLTATADSPIVPPPVHVPGLSFLTDLSPDMRWLAYTATALGEFRGQFEVYAVRLDGGSATLRISRGLGETPRWSPSGDGLYYRSGRRYYWVPSYGDLAAEPFGDPELFVSGSFNNVSGRAEEVSTDGSALLLLLPDGVPQTATLDFITNFRTRLAERLGTVE